MAENISFTNRTGVELASRIDLTPVGTTVDVPLSLEAIAKKRSDG